MEELRHNDEEEEDDVLFADDLWEKLLRKGGDLDDVFLCEKLLIREGSKE